MFASDSSYAEYSQAVPKGMLGLHLSVYFGLRTIVMSLLEWRDGAANLRDEGGRTPLSWAAAVVMVLLINREDVAADSPFRWKLPFSRCS
jgi:hypothetical protein